MRIFTSRYANRDLAARTDLVKVSISIGAPRFKLGYAINYSMSSLMPTTAMVRRVHQGRLSEDDYRRAYIDRLEIAGLAAIQRDFATIYGEMPGDLVLLCFEDLRKPGAWCHRRIFASWWKEQTGEDVLELELMEEGRGVDFAV